MSASFLMSAMPTIILSAIANRKTDRSMDQKVLARIPIQQTGCPLAHVEIRESPFGDPHTVEVVLPDVCHNKVILPLSLFNEQEVRMR